VPTDLQASEKHGRADLHLAARQASHRRRVHGAARSPVRELVISRQCWAADSAMKRQVRHGKHFDEYANRFCREQSAYVAFKLMSYLFSS
jgi:hypothetical protein